MYTCQSFCCCTDFHLGNVLTILGHFYAYNPRFLYLRFLLSDMCSSHSLCLTKIPYTNTYIIILSSEPKWFWLWSKKFPKSHLPKYSIDVYRRCLLIATLSISSARCLVYALIELANERLVGKELLEKGESLSHGNLLPLEISKRNCFDLSDSL